MKQLPEIDVIRIVLIFLLLLYHALLPWCGDAIGSWQPLPNAKGNDFYWWLGRFSYSFFLECFVFISGYILAYQTERKGSQALILKHIAIGKFKRLIIPSIFFSALYLIIFGFMENESIFNAIYSIFNGRGHMWFLPMLFWCFIEFSILARVPIRSKYKLILLSAFAFFPFLQIPFRIGNSFYYLLFFFLGYNFFSARSKVLNKLSSPTNLAILGIFYAMCFIISTNINLHLTDSLSELGLKGTSLKLVNHLIVTSEKIAYALLGIIFLVASVNYIINIKKLLQNKIFTALASGCFIVYLVQQFILLWLYYHTNISSLIDPLLVPWMGIGCACFISWVSYRIALTNRLTKTLLGL